MISLSGCTWIKSQSWIPYFGNKNNTPVAEVPVIEKVEEPVQLIIDEGRMIFPDRLSKGGKLLLIPFRAGPNVEDSKALDQIAHRIMQGINLALQDQRPYFKVLINVDNAYPDYVIDGYFTVKKESSNLNKWVLRSKKYVLAVEGKMADANTKEVMATFTESVKSKEADEDFMLLGFEIGQNIGEFIRTNIP